MVVSIIVAVGRNNVIGNKNTLPWNLPADLKMFKEITSNHFMLMGRKTYESIGRPLPNRTSVVITSQKDYIAPGCIIVHSLEEALEVSKNEEEVFVIGGSELFKHALNIADKIHITKIDSDFEGDVFFPEINEVEWITMSTKKFEPYEKNIYNYSFNIMLRK
jgi:dihydrofolate reductase